MKNLLALVVAASCLGVAAQAADFSYTGNFADDDDVVLFNFTVAMESEVTLRSYSYAGGTQADGNVVSAGGFDPILTLLDSSGMIIEEQDDGDGVPNDPVTGLAFDVLFQEALMAGDYTVAVSQLPNFLDGDTLSDGFAFEDAPNFTSELVCSNGIFCDVRGNNRTSAFAFDVLNVDTADVDPPTQPTQPTTPVPMPASLPLMVGGLAGLALLRRRRA